MNLTRRLVEYLTLGTLATVASVVGIGAGVNSLTGGKLLGGGGGGGGGGSSTYVPTGQGAADQTWQTALQSALQQAQASGAQISPALMQGFQQMMGVPTQGLTGAANYAGDIYGNMVGTAQQGQQALQGQAGQNYANQAPLLAAGNSVWNTAQDPQNALRNQLQQQTVDASRAGSSARGIGMGGEAAGMENDAVRNFLLNWQQQQLQRQVQGSGAMNAAYGAAGQQGFAGNQALAGAVDMGNTAAGFAQQAGSTPYNAQMQVAQTPFNAANAYQQGVSGNLGQLGGIMNNAVQYMNQGQGATNQLFGQQQQGLGNLAQGLNSFGRSPGGTALGNWLQTNPFQNYGSGATQTGGPGGSDTGGPAPNPWGYGGGGG